MLQDFRENISGAAKFIVILIAIPFAFFGIESVFFTGASVEEAAEVDGERITRLELAQAVQRQRNLIQQQYGELDPATVSDELLRGPVLQNMARAKVLENQARRTGMAIAPSTISSLLQKVDIFQADGVFSKDNYLLYLAQNQYTPQTHRRFLESELLVSQLAQGVGSTGFLTSSEREQMIALMGQSRDFHYLILPLAEMRDSVELSAGEIENYHQQHSEQFVAAETVVLDYIELKLVDLAASIELEETVIENYYAEQQAAAEASKRLFVGHIMIESQPDDSHRETLESVLSALEQGDEFAAVARKYSEDALSSEQGGELGEFIAADVPPRFRTTVEQLQVGEVSEPVEIDQAWHVIKILREEKTIVRSFEEERERMAGDLRRQLAFDLIPEKTDQLGDLAYNSESLAEVAEEMGLELKTSSPLTRDGNADLETEVAGIGRYPLALEAAYSEDVLVNGYASEVLELSEGHFVVVKLNEHRPARILPLEEVRDQVENALKTEKAALALQAQAREYVASIRAGESVEGVATASKLDWQVSLDTTRYASDANQEVVQQVFSLPLATPVPAVRWFATTTGDVVVYSLSAIREGSAQELAGEQLSAMQLSLSRASATRDFSAYQQQLLADSDIEFRSLPAVN